MVTVSSLERGLRKEAYRIESEAHAAGLDFFEVVFEMLDARDVNAVAAYGGFPTRYSSWRFGMSFERLQKGYEYGLSKIYELVINNDPTIAYLVRSNSLMEQKLVMTHVFGHADFFKHNVWFSPTERQMVESMERNAERIRGHMDALGQDVVESFMDVALALEGLIDPYKPLRDMRAKSKRAPGSSQGLAERARRNLEAMIQLGGRVEVARATAKDAEFPTYDILGFLLEHAPLPSWQQDVLRIVRDEAYYFAPQRMTKIINEGWASFWHSRLLTTGILDNSEIIDFADCHSGATATAPGQLNPYKLGIELFRHAELQGKDLFRLRSMHNDVSFIDEIIDEEFTKRNSLFVYRKNARTGRNEVVDREWRSVKSELLRELSWGCTPQIQLVSVDAKGRGELRLQHVHDGRDIKLDEASQLVQHIGSIWGGPVNLHTLDDRQARRVESDGAEVRIVDDADEGPSLPNEVTEPGAGEESAA
ncbi:MAG: stage V sporulation protein R [Planctomycetota bacterium]|jgi:stage V sporulation protein R